MLLLLLVVLKRNRSKREEEKKRRFEGNKKMMHACLSFSYFNTVLHVKIVSITISFYLL